MINSSTKKLYEKHHRDTRSPGFSILKDVRGKMFSALIGKGKTILDIGCRDGVLTQYYLSENNVLGVDVDSIALNRAKDLGINVCEMDLYGNWEEINENNFDVVVAGEVLEHLFYPDEIIDKLVKHLKNEGVFIGSVPNAFSLKNRFKYLFGIKKGTPMSDPTHVNHFSRRELKNLLSKHFTSVEILPLGRFMWLDWLWPGMFSFDLIFICKK